MRISLGKDIREREEGGGGGGDEMVDRIHTLRVIGSDSDALTLVEYDNDAYLPKITGRVRIFLSRSEGSLTINHTPEKAYRDRKPTQFDATRVEFKFSTIIVTNSAHLLIRQAAGFFALTTLGHRPWSGSVAIERLTMGATRKGVIMICGDLDDCVVNEAIFDASERGSIAFQNLPLSCRVATVSVLGGGRFEGLSVLTELHLSLEGGTDPSQLQRVGAAESVMLMLCMVSPGGRRELEHRASFDEVSTIQPSRALSRLAYRVDCAISGVGEEEEWSEYEDGSGMMSEEESGGSGDEEEESGGSEEEEEMLDERDYDIGTLLGPSTVGATIVVSDYSNGDDDLEWRGYFEQRRVDEERSGSFGRTQMREVLEASRAVSDRRSKTVKEKEMGARKIRIEAFEAVEKARGGKGVKRAREEDGSCCAVCTELYSAERRRGRFVGCGHVDVCYPCARRCFIEIGHCPLCRKESMVIER